MAKNIDNQMFCGKITKKCKCNAEAKQPIGKEARGDW
jgi:hypothetical protein